MKHIGHLESWNTIWNIFKNEVDLQEKKRLMRGLAGIRESWVLQKYIENAWDEENIPRHDYFQCLLYISESNYGNSLVWDHIRDNWMRIEERYTPFDRNLEKLILSITKTFCTSVKLREVEKFFEKYPAIASDVKKLALENIHSNIFWIDSNSSRICDWLVENGF